MLLVKALIARLGRLKTAAEPASSRTLNAVPEQPGPDSAALRLWTHPNAEEIPVRLGQEFRPARLHRMIVAQGPPRCPPANRQRDSPKACLEHPNQGRTAMLRLDPDGGASGGSDEIYAAKTETETDRRGKDGRHAPVPFCGVREKEFRHRIGGERLGQHDCEA
jgi:hypothetical protein